MFEMIFWQKTHWYVIGTIYYPYFYVTYQVLYILLNKFFFSKKPYIISKDIFVMLFETVAWDWWSGCSSYRSGPGINEVEIRSLRKICGVIQADRVRSDSFDPVRTGTWREREGRPEKKCRCRNKKGPMMLLLQWLRHVKGGRWKFYKTDLQYDAHVGTGVNQDWVVLKRFATGVIV